MCGVLLRHEVEKHIHNCEAKIKLKYLIHIRFDIQGFIRGKTTRIFTKGILFQNEGDYKSQVVELFDKVTRVRTSTNTRTSRSYSQIKSNDSRAIFSFS